MNLAGLPSCLTVSCPLPLPSVVWTLTGHTDRVESAAFSPDGRTPATVSYDGTVQLWTSQ